MTCGNYLKAGLRVLLWALALAAGIACSFFGIAGAVSLLRGSPVFGSENLFLSVICALIAWFFVVIFHFGKETILLPVNQPATFLANARRVLHELGYEVGRAAADSLATRHGFQSMLFCRGIQIHCVDRQARITGPKIWVDLLRRRLRVLNILVGSQASLEETQLRDAPILLKRVQLRMRVPPEKLAEVSRHVLGLLTGQAEVVCEVSLMAQSETGIREYTIERHIRGWLSEQGITAEIHKDLAKMSEAPSSVIVAGELRRQLAASGTKKPV